MVSPSGMILKIHNVHVGFTQLLDKWVFVEMRERNTFPRGKVLK